MDLKEYCGSNNVDYDKFVEILKNYTIDAEEENIRIYINEYHIGIIFNPKYTNEDGIFLSFVELNIQIEKDRGTWAEDKMYISASLKFYLDRILDFINKRKNIRDEKGKLCYSAKLLNKVINCINELFTVLESDTTELELKKCINFLTQIKESAYYNKYYLYVRKSNAYFKIEQGPKISDTWKTVDDYTKFNIVYKNRDEGITFDRIVDNLSDLKKALNKVVILMEDNDEWLQYSKELSSFL